MGWTFTIYEQQLTLPPLFAVQGHVQGNLIEQLSQPAAKFECTLQHFTEKHVGGFEARLPSGELLRVLPKKTAAKIAGVSFPGPQTVQSIASAHR